MSIAIHVTGDTAAEVLKHLSQLTQGLSGSATSALATGAPCPATTGEVSSETAAPEPKAASTRKPRETAKKKEEPVVSSGGSESASAADDTPTEPDVPAAEQVVDNEPVRLDFDKDVAPKVLGYVRLKGKPWVEEILNEFGVRRASDLEDSRLPELLSALDDRGGPLP